MKNAHDVECPDDEAMSTDVAERRRNDQVAIPRDESLHSSSNFYGLAARVFSNRSVLSQVVLDDTEWPSRIGSWFSSVSDDNNVNNNDDNAATAAVHNNASEDVEVALSSPSDEESSLEEEESAAADNHAFPRIDSMSTISQSTMYINSDSALQLLQSQYRTNSWQRPKSQAEFQLRPRQDETSIDQPQRPARRVLEHSLPPIYSRSTSDKELSVHPAVKGTDSGDDPLTPPRDKSSSSPFTVSSEPVASTAITEETTTSCHWDVQHPKAVNGSGKTNVTTWQRIKMRFYRPVVLVPIFMLCFIVTIVLAIEFGRAMNENNATMSSSSEATGGATNNNHILTLDELAKQYSNFSDDGDRISNEDTTLVMADMADSKRPTQMNFTATAATPYRLPNLNP